MFLLSLYRRRTIQKNNKHNDVELLSSIQKVPDMKPTYYPGQMTIIYEGLKPILLLKRRKEIYLITW